MRLNKIIIVFFFIIGNIVVVFSQKRKITRDSLIHKAPEKLKEVVISGTRTKRELSSLPMPVTLISKKDITESNTLRLNNILEEQTGLVVVNDHGQGIQIQGLAPDYTLIMIDDMPMIGRTAGTFDLDRIAVGDIEQVEVVKGASSSLYGNEAMAGVINIITARPKKGFHLNTSFLAETNNTKDINLNLSYAKKKVMFSLFVNRNSSDGFKNLRNIEFNIVDPFSRNTFSTKLAYSFSSKTNLKFSSRVFSSMGADRPNSELFGKTRILEYSNLAKLDHKITKKIGLEVELYQTNYLANSFLNEIVSGKENSKSDYDHTLLRPEVRIVYKNSNISSTIIGVGSTYERLDRTSFSNKPVFNAPYVYAQFDTKPLSNLNVIVGARYDFHNEYRSQFSPKLSAKYNISSVISLKGSLGYGYKAPAFRQLYLDFTNPSAGYSVLGYNRVVDLMEKFIDNKELILKNTSLDRISEMFTDGLKPESSISLNGGFVIKPISKITININGFLNQIFNLIDTFSFQDLKENGNPIFSYRNFKKVQTKGVEVDIRWKINKNLRVASGYQYLMAKEDSVIEAFKTGKLTARVKIGNSVFDFEDVSLRVKDYLGLNNRSKHTYNFKTFYKIPNSKISMNGRLIYRSKFGISDTNGNGFLDIYDNLVKGYALFNTAINISFKNNIKLSCGANNLFDYQFNKNTIISNLPGRLLYAKINYKF